MSSGHATSSISRPSACRPNTCTVVTSTISTRPCACAVSVGFVLPTCGLVNIHDHSHNPDRAGYRYVSDIITPSLTLLAEMCPIGSVDIDAPKLNTYQVMRCFEWPVKVDSMDHITQRSLPGCTRL
ncbi:MAG: hypothetical protein ACLUNS_10225 [Alistipes shahii]